MRIPMRWEWIDEGCERTSNGGGALGQKAEGENYGLKRVMQAPELGCSGRRRNTEPLAGNG